MKSGLFDGLLYGVGLVAFLAMMGLIAGVRINLTESLPLGLYIRDPRGALAEFCPDEP